MTNVLPLISVSFITFLKPAESRENLSFPPSSEQSTPAIVGELRTGVSSESRRAEVLGADGEVRLGEE